MRYEIRALSVENRVVTLLVEARDEANARTQAVARSLRPLSIRGVASAGFGRQRSGLSLLLFSEELLALLDAGLSIVEALDSMQEKSGPGTMRDVAQALAQSVRQGLKLSDAMGALPQIFPPLFIGLIQAAETTSGLPSVLGRYVEFESRLSQVRNKAVSAAIYPCILLVVGSAVTLFLLGYVVPRFASVYEDSGRPMSFLTALLLDWGRFIAEHSGWVALAAAAAPILGYAAWRVLATRYSAADLLARLPGLRARVRSFEMSRLYLALGLLLNGGIPLIRALPLITPVVGAETRTHLQRVGSRVASGESFSSSMAAEALADTVALRLFRVGERAGRLDEMLSRAARFHDAALTHFIDRLTRAAEPILMAAIGIVVGSIVVLLYMPIFELAGSLQ